MGPHSTDPGSSIDNSLVLCLYERNGTPWVISQQCVLELVQPAYSNTAAGITIWEGSFSFEIQISILAFPID